MPIIVDSVDDRVKLHLGDLLVRNCILQAALDQANTKLALLEGPKDLADQDAEPEKSTEKQ